MLRLAFIAACALFTVAVGPSTVQAAPERYALDPEHTTIAFLVSHVGFAGTLGRFTDARGAFTWDAEAQVLSDVQIVVNTASVDTDHDARDEHVRGTDFLDVKRHPEMTFASVGPITVEDDSVRLNGELSLLGQTRALSLDVTVNKAGAYPFGHGKQTLGLSARGTLRRSEFGMAYAVANGLVGDEVELIIEAEAPRE